MSLVVYQQRLQYFLLTLASMMKERIQLSLLLFLERISEGAARGCSLQSPRTGS